MKRAVLLAGGKGSRMLESTKIHNKHLLPVYSDQGAIPMIWYPLSTLIKSGCKDILIISSQEHCGDIIEFLGDGKSFGASFSYAIQDHSDPSRPVGIAGALKLCQSFVGEDPFAVILGDNFYENNFEDNFDYFNLAVTDELHTDIAHVFLKQVNDPERFGVATIKDNVITEIVEKPRTPKSDYAVTGLYLYTKHVFTLLPTLKPSKRGELEVSDINDWYVKNKKMGYAVIPGFWHDMGTPQSMIRTQKFIADANFTVDFT